MAFVCDSMLLFTKGRYANIRMMTLEQTLAAE